MLSRMMEGICKRNPCMAAMQGFVVSFGVQCEAEYGRGVVIILVGDPHCRLVSQVIDYAVYGTAVAVVIVPCPSANDGKNIQTVAALKLLRFLPLTFSSTLYFLFP